MQGLIFDIKRYAVHDGPGIRTTIFFKACPLNCWWCHNPESQDVKTQKLVNKIIIDGITLEQTEYIGKVMTVDELMTEIRKDILFFDESGGGVTFSGGEPLMQFDFLYEVLKRCKQENIHTCVDTSGLISSEKIEKIIPYTDLFLYDLKHFDDTLHKKYTGVSNKLILKNFELLYKKNAKIRARFPLIPGINDTDENIEMLKQFLTKNSLIEQLDILPYHNIANHKYKKISKENLLKELKIPTENYVDKVRAEIQKAFKRVQIGG